MSHTKPFIVSVTWAHLTSWMSSYFLYCNGGTVCIRERAILTHIRTSSVARIHKRYGNEESTGWNFSYRLNHRRRDFAVEL